MQNWKSTLDGHRTVAVTGGCGAIGAEMINYFARKYTLTKFINIDKLTYSGKAENVSTDHSNYKLYKVDICDQSNVQRIFHAEQPTLLIHLAAETHVDKSFTNSLEFTHTNILGTHTLLECVREYGNFKKIIHMSTDEVYGASDDLCKESSIFSPSNPYAASKAGAELLCHSYVKSFGLPIVIARCNNAVSKYQDPSKLIPMCFQKIKSSQKIPIHGDGLSKRTFVHAIDISRAIELIAKKATTGDTFNIGTRFEYTVLEVVQKILSIIKPGESISDWITFVPDRPFQDHRYKVDTLAITELGWEPTINFDDALYLVT
ncbi:NAD-dependent epimerase/dehydratase family protein [bacterium]|nr:NAD-dependent epimerase/dehydratase family protein [bacterium]